MNWLARITTPAGAMLLNHSMTWLPDTAVFEDNEELHLLLQWANLLTQPPMYEYSPADGLQGRVPAQRVAQALKENFGEGEVELEFPDTQPLAPGTIA